MRYFYMFVIFFALFFNNYIFAKPLSNARRKRNAVKDESKLWPKATVPYVIDFTFSASESKVIEEAMNDISSFSCIVFKRQTNEPVFVKFLKGMRCHAPIGYTGRNRKLTLNGECIKKRRITHMLFHTLGFYHEHNRPDRDNYVIVHYDNIHPSLLSSFTKKSSEKVTTLGLPYDYNSILHYHDRAGAKSPSVRTLEYIRPNTVFGNAGEMSMMDIVKLNRLYRCTNNNTTSDGLEDDEGSGLTGVEDDEGSGLTGVEDDE